MITCKNCILYILLIVTLGLNAQYNSKEEYIDKYKKIAVDEMKRSGIPASITLAQGMLESENGNSTLPENPTIILALNATKLGMVKRFTAMMTGIMNALENIRLLRIPIAIIRIFL